MNFTGGPKPIKYTDGTPSREVEDVALETTDAPLTSQIRHRLMNALELINKIDEELEKV